MSSRGSCTIYVGNLPGDVREREIEDLFYKYGRIVEIDLKLPPRPPGYCFIEFEDARDAEDAIRGRDGYSFDGHRLRVELAHGGRGSSSSFDRYNNYSSSSGRSSGVPRRSDYRVIVTGLPSSASWQDLKDHMRRAGDVCFAQVFRDRGGAMGVVDYTNYEDMKYAIQKLDDSEFRNPFSRSYIRVREDKGHGYRKSLSRSRSRSYSRSPSHEYYKRCHYGRGYTRSRSRSYSSYSDDRGSYARSPSYSKGRSLSRSRSRSLSPSRSRSISPRSRSVSRSRSRSRSPSKSHSKSRSRSHSPSHSRSGSPARSPGRSLSPASNGD